MSCIFYLTDFSERSTKALEFILPIADELRARVIFVHLINGQAQGQKERVTKKEEQEFLPDFNRLKQKVISYAFTNNCEMLTGHILLKGDLVENMKSVVRKLPPYAIVTPYTYASKSKSILNNRYDKLLRSVNSPLLIIPEYMESHSIKAIGYFSEIIEKLHGELYNLIFMMGMFKSSLFAFYLPGRSANDTDHIYEEMKTKFPSSLETERLTFKPLDTKYVASKVDKLVDSMQIQLAAFNAGDKIFEDIFLSGNSVRPFLLKTPVIIYPVNYRMSEN